VCLHTGIYGLNSYAGPLSDDIRLTETDYTVTELTEATNYYLEQANRLAAEVKRDANGDPIFPTFEEMAETAGDGFETLTMEKSLSVFAGSRVPVKKLGWADMYTSMGITGISMPLTGEAAVNPRIPDQGIPFAMAHEMAHRLCIARDDETNFAAFLSCAANENLEYQYSGYFMAYRFCIEALQSVDAEAAEKIAAGCSDALKADIDGYDRYFDENRDDKLTTRLVSTVTDTYNEATTNEEVRYSSVCDYLVNWHISEYTEPEEVETKFDPFDETQVDLSGLVNAKEQEEPAE
jgi:hypothetical protein